MNVTPVFGSLALVSQDDLYAAFNEAFKDYDRTWTREEFEDMLTRRGYRPDLSFGIFDNGRLVSFTLNCAGIFKGAGTVYDTGTGTIETYRRQGLGTRIFNESIPFIKQSGATQYLLEVLQHNKAAVSIYRQIGFQVNRELNYFVQKKEHIRLMDASLGTDFFAQEITLDHAAQMEACHDFYPSWQNNFAALKRAAGEFKMTGIFHGTSLAGYGIIAPSSGDIAAIAVHPSYRRQKTGTAVFNELVLQNKAPVVKVLNTDAADRGITDFLLHVGLPLSGSQYEMILAL